MFSTLKKALQHDIKPAFGSVNDQLIQAISNGIIAFGPKVVKNLSSMDLLIAKTKTATKLRLTTVLVEGCAKYGSTAFAANFAMKSKCEYTKIICPNSMVGLGEMSKNNTINKIFKDAYKCDNSCIFIDDFERIIEYVDVGPIFSNTILQTLVTYLKNQPPNVIF